MFQVSTPLSFDTATTNIIELGHAALIIISNSQNISDSEIFHYSNDDSKCEPRLSLATASVRHALSSTRLEVMGKITGQNACSDVAVTSLGEGVQLVKFEPKVSDEYKLSICYIGYDIQGSHYITKAIEKGVLATKWTLE